MTRSMTAFSRVDVGDENGAISWEIRSVNHRYLDLSQFLPDGFQSLENEFKGKFQQCLKRGKVEAKLRYTLSSDADAREIAINEGKVKALLAAQSTLQNLAKSELPLSCTEILQWEGVIQPVDESLDNLFDLARQGLEQALQKLLAHREREGAQLARFIRQRSTEITHTVSGVRKRRKAVMSALRDKVLARLADLDVQPDTNRLEQELVFQAQRLDVDEELDRLEAHLKEVESVLQKDEAIGRRLDFLMQELNREANTLASKSNDAETTRSAVDLKVWIEQMREQVMNIE